MLICSHYARATVVLKSVDYLTGGSKILIDQEKNSFKKLGNILFSTLFGTVATERSFVLSSFHV